MAFSFSDLKIAPYGDQISNDLHEHHAITVSAPTGSGKTRFLPQFFAQKGYKVRVAVPTIIATKNSYEFVKKWSNLSIGFAAGRERNYNNFDDVVYCTTGHLVSRYLHTKDPSVFGDVLLIDEVHMESIYVTLLIGLVSSLQVKPYIVLTSATMNAKDIQLFFPDIHHVVIEEDTYPVEEISCFDEKDAFEKVEREFTSDISDKKWGLWFVPGKDEALRLTADLTKALERYGVWVFPLFSKMNDTEINEIVNCEENLVLIVATNMVESSVTLPHLHFVVDGMTEKRVKENESGQVELLQYTISHDAHTQRKGRVGRLRPGRCYNMLPLSCLESTPDREIDRVPCYEALLDLLSNGYNLEEANGILRIPPKRIRESFAMLENLGLLRNGYVTDLGKKATRYKMTIWNSVMVCHAVEKKNLAILVIACMLENMDSGLLYVPYPKPWKKNYDINVDRAETERAQKIFAGTTPLQVYLKIYQVWKNERMTLRDFCNDYRVRFRPFLAFIRNLDAIIRIHPEFEHDRFEKIDRATFEELYFSFASAYRHNLMIPKDRKYALARLQNSPLYILSRRGIPSKDHGKGKYISANLSSIEKNGRMLYFANFNVPYVKM